MRCYDPLFLVLWVLLLATSYSNISISVTAVSIDVDVYANTCAVSIRRP